MNDEPARRISTPNALSLRMAVLLLALHASLAHAHSDGANTRGDAPTSVGIAGKASDVSYQLRPAPPNTAIQQAIAQVSAAQIEHTISTLVGFQNRNTLSSMDQGLPTGQGVKAAADWIESELQRYSAACRGCLAVHRDTFTEPDNPRGRFPRATTITNVYAVLRGSDPVQAKRMYLVTGHYDSRGTDVLDTRKTAPGANDDASGVAVSLECARVLSKLHLPATLVFVAVAGEEQGLNGSAHLAQLARSEGWQLEGALNNDIVGGDTTPGDRLQDKSAVRVFSEGIPAAASPAQVRALAAMGAESDSPSRELARAVTDVARTYFPAPQSTPAPRFHPVLEFRRDRFQRGGDHTSFNKEGFAAVRFTEWRENFNHQHQDLRTENGVEYGDLLEFVDFNYAAKVARLNAATLATLAAAPPPPRDIKIENKTLDNNTTMGWSAPEGFDAANTSASGPARYEVVWRATASPDWEFAQEFDAKQQNESVTLPVSKDNVVFGVRSVDAAGHHSLVAVPTPDQ